MHHLSPLRKGGPNTADNLIPLCHVCHNDVEELVQLGITAEEFLKIPTTVDFLIASRNRDIDQNKSFEEVLDLTRRIGREMESAKYEEKRQEDWPEYWDLWAAEKAAFPLLENIDW